MSEIPNQLTDVTVVCKANVYFEGKVVSHTVLTRTGLAGSNTGGIRETQDMLDFCALQGIKPQITKITMDGINDAWIQRRASIGRCRRKLVLPSRRRSIAD